ncbi:MAG: NAD(P)/FAD-dependent oxidoreductase [Gammaproteobacteria bacterium]
MAHSQGFRALVRVFQQARRNVLAAQGRNTPVLQSASRRQFMRNAALGGAALTAAGSLSGCWGGRRDVVIVGGGLAGLTAAFQLGKAGVRAQVYEARNRVGGRIRSVEGIVSDGIVTDLGAELVNSDHDDLRALLDEFAIPLIERKAEHAGLEQVGYFFGGVRRSEAEMAAALQPLAAQIMADAELLDADWDTWGPVFDQLSVADYLDQHSNLLPADPAIRTLMEGLVRVEYGVEADSSSALHLLYMLPVVDGDHVELLSSSDEAWVISGGSESVIGALKAVLADRIHTGMSLTSLEQTRQGYLLTFNGTRKVHARYVVLALPLPALRKVNMTVELPETLQRFIQEVDLGRNEKIVAGMQQRTWRTADGFKNEAWSDQAQDLIWDSSLRELATRDNGALTFFLGGEQVEAVASGTARQQGTALLEQYDSLLPGLQASANGRFVRTSWHTTNGIMGGYTNFRPGQYSDFAWEWMYVESDDPDEAQTPCVERLLLAGEHTSDEYYGFMNGAAQTGRLAAQWIVADMAAAQAGDTDANL